MAMKPKLIKDFWNKVGWRVGLEKACKKRVEIDDRKNMVLKPSW